MTAAARRHVVIVGNGVGGISAARHLRQRGDDRITVISSESDHFFARTALMYVYMGQLRLADTKPYDDGFWAKNRIELRRAHVEAIDPTGRRLRLSGGESLAYDVLVLAVGSRPNRMPWPGADLPGVQGLYSLQDLERMEQATRGVERAVVVGGGLIGVEMAEMLHSRGIAVTMLVRESGWMSHVLPNEESELIGRHLRAAGVDLRLSRDLERLEPGPDGRVAAAVTRDGEVVHGAFVGLTIGVSPNIDFVRSSGLECGAGILVDEQLRASAPHVYAVGDCAELRHPAPGRQPIEALWYVARRMGETLAQVLGGEDVVYDPGIWFNSAKFFDLEHQVYGQVPAAPAPGVESLAWRDEHGRRLVRLCWRAPEGPVLGFNLLGVRYRQEVCEAWIRRGTPIREVLADLGAADFDPELTAEHAAALIAAFNARYGGAAVRLRRRRGLRAALAVLAGATP